MLKTYDELRQVDVRPYCDVRKEGKEEIPYLNWAKCIDLLHINGAEKVYFEPVQMPNGSSLIAAGYEFTDKNDVTNRVYETRIRVVIDDDVFEFQGPVMNGTNPVKDNSMSQQRLWNCQCRLFVKAVALHTGLGFDLWLSNEDKEERIAAEANFQHDIMKVRERVLEGFTTLNKRGLSKADIAKHMGITSDEVDIQFKQYVALANFENKLIKLLHDTQ